MKITVSNLITRMLRASALLIVCASLANAAEPEFKLAPDEAVVLVRLVGSDSPFFWFKRFDSRSGFRVENTSEPQLIVVPAGLYYPLRDATAEQSLDDILPTGKLDIEIHRKSPLDIRPGTVSYIGDWTVEKKMKRKREYSTMQPTYQVKTITEARSKHAIDAFPILICSPGRPLVRLDSKEVLPSVQQDRRP